MTVLLSEIPSPPAGERARVRGNQRRRICQAQNGIRRPFPVTLPLLRNGPLPLPRWGRG